MRPLPHLILIISLADFVATTGYAAVITAIGENSTNAASWRTASAGKAINPAKNNIYGNDGYVMFTTSAVGAGSGSIGGNSSINPFTYNGTPAISGVTPPVTTLNVMPTYVSAFTPSTVSGQVFDGVATGDAQFDNPKVPGGKLQSGVGFMGEPISGAVNQPFFSFTVNSKVPASFTVGLFFTTSGGISTAAGIMGGGVTTPVTITKSVNNDSILDALFFTIRGAVAGDTYTVVGSGPGGSLFGNNIDIMGITFDSTPEPTTLGGCTAASLALIWLSRKRKRPGCSQG